MRLKEWLGGTLKGWCANHGMVLALYTEGDRKARLQDVVRIKASGRLLQNPAEACQLISALRATKVIDGDIAEVGTAFGGSARLIGEYSGGKKIHVFDTFEGLPEPDVRDAGVFTKGSYACSPGNSSFWVQLLQTSAGTFASCRSWAAFRRAVTSFPSVKTFGSNIMFC
jgi:hypothetical protein